MCNMKDEIAEGKKMIEKFGDNYLYAREIEDEASDEGFSQGVIIGFICGTIATLLVLALYLSL